MDWLTIATMTAVALFAILALFQVALAAGVPWGHAAYGGANRELSTGLRITSGVAVGIWLFAILLVIRRSEGEGLIFLSPGALSISCWVLAAYLAIGTVMNGISRSKAERNIWTPVSAVSLVAVAMVNLLAD